MDPRILVSVNAVGRMAIGVALMAEPKLVFMSWLGRRETKRRSIDLLGRGFGARDFVVGAGSMASVNDRRALRRWLAAAVVCDVVDGAATLAHRDDLPAPTRDLVVGVAAGGALLGVAAIAMLGSSEEPVGPQ